MAFVSFSSPNSNPAAMLAQPRKTMLRLAKQANHRYFRRRNGLISFSRLADSRQLAPGFPLSETTTNSGPGKALLPPIPKSEDEPSCLLRFSKEQKGGGLPAFRDHSRAADARPKRNCKANPPGGLHH
jgi:hypothetical protein